MKWLLTTSLTMLLFSTMTLAQSSESTHPGNSGASPQTSQPAATQGSAPATAGANAGASNGAVIAAVLDKTVDAKKARQGDQVIAKTMQDMKSPDGQVIPRNSKLIGHVTEVKARGNGQEQSTLGIVFDKIQVGKDKEMPFHAVIQALAPPPVATLAPEPGGGPEPGPAGSSAPGSGGTTGSVNASGAPMNRGTNSGNMGTNAGSPAGDMSGGTGVSKGDAGGNLTSTSKGAIGMKDVQLSTVDASGTQASMLTSTSSNVKLSSGTRMVLRLSAQ